MGRVLQRRYGRARAPEGPSTLTLDDELVARRIGTGESKSMRAPTETWAVHPHGDPGGSVLQVQLFRQSGARWAAWTGSYSRAKDRELAERVAAARNKS